MTDFLTAFDELNQALAGEGDRLANLPLELIDEDDANPRDSFDAAELAALAATIHERGVLQPIVVRPPNGAGRYQIRFGARRFRAARLAGLPDIPALIRSRGEGEVESLIEQVIENDQRATLNTAQMARTVALLLDRGLTQAEIGARLGRPKDLIAMLAAVPAMPEKLQKLAGALGARTIYELFQGWKADPAGVEVWLQGRDPETITQVQARALAVSGRVNGMRAGSKSGRQPVRGRGDEPLEWVIEVVVGDRSGRLVLAAGPSTDVVLVAFRASAAPERVQASDIRLIGISPKD